MNMSGAARPSLKEVFENATTERPNRKSTVPSLMEAVDSRSAQWTAEILMQVDRLDGEFSGLVNRLNRLLPKDVPVETLQAVDEIHIGNSQMAREVGDIRTRLRMLCERVVAVAANIEA